MEIQDRLFSENSEETLYSVLMNESEYSLYSEFQKEFGGKYSNRRAAKYTKQMVNWIKQTNSGKPLEIAEKEIPSRSHSYICDMFNLEHNDAVNKGLEKTARGRAILKKGM